MGKYSWKYKFICITWYLKYVKWFEYIMLNPFSWNLKVVRHQLFHVWLTYFCGVHEYFYISFILIFFRFKMKCEVKWKYGPFFWCRHLWGESSVFQKIIRSCFHIAFLLNYSAPISMIKIWAVINLFPNGCENFQNTFFVLLFGSVITDQPLDIFIASP